MSLLVPIGLTAGLAIVFELLILRFILSLLRNTGVVRQNYRGVYIPVAVGITFPMTVLLTQTVLQLAGRTMGEQFTVYLLGITFISLLGLLDDLLGSRDALGFRGHFSRLLRGELTTGGLKALGGGFVALYMAVQFSPSWRDLLVNVLLLALFTNLINLLDLRPGRAVKGFLLIFLVIPTVARVQFQIYVPLVAAMLAYFPFDLKAKVMMGDAGSNVLGLTLGTMCVLGMDLPFRLGTLAFLILVHLFTEKYSLTEIIDRFAVLRYLDNLGRGDKTSGK